MKAQKFIPLLAIGVGLLVYANSLHDGFVFDDAPHIVENARIRQVWPPWEVLAHTSRPLVMLSLALNYAWGGLNPWGYHLFNIVIHILATLTLYGVVRLTFSSETLRSRYGETAPWLAGVVALLWLVHPLQTESVTYVIQRGESLMGLFYLMTLYCVIRSRGSSKSSLWQAGAVVSCVLGMASKPVMVTAPIVVLLYDRLFLARSWRELMQQRGKLYACFAATWALLPVLLTNGASEWKPSAGLDFGGLPTLQYALTQPGVILHYLRLTFWPNSLCFDYGWNYGWSSAQTIGEAFPELIVIGLLIAATTYAWRRHQPLAFLGLWFLLTLAPTSSFVSLSDVVVEHRMYLPLAAVAVAVSVGVFELGRGVLNQQWPKAFTWAAYGVLIMLLALLTIRRNLDYRTELALWQDTVAKCPNNPRAHYNIGVILAREGKVQEAIGQYERALRIKPNYADAEYNLGGAVLQAGRLPEAIEHWQKAVRIKPDFAEAYYNLGNALLQTGKPDEAILDWKQALRIKPDYTEAHNDLAVALTHLGNVQEAIEHWKQAVQIRPGYADAHYNLGVALERVGKTPEAITHYEQAVQADPHMTEAQNRLMRLRTK